MKVGKGKFTSKCNIVRLIIDVIDYVTTLLSMG